MPVAFDKCIKKGGIVKTRTIPGGKYQRICYLGKEAFPGEIKKKKKK
jgi:hypothetical protein